MRMFMTFMCLPFITLILGLLINDFHYALVAVVLAIYLTYLFWDKWFDAIKKTAKRSNA
ncbi:hypothetical protein ACWEWU_13175 [Staphylococcus xylosus]|uniref:hypothetical protein n=1 Tax=Staphylococcus xylosus TaxID=1288 RepID=UPI0015FBCF3C|nr:hypothetical protein [Staphylococcus xylosus]